MKSPSSKSVRNATGFMLGGPFHRKNNKSVFTSAQKLSYQPTAVTSFAVSDASRGDNRSASVFNNSVDETSGLDGHLEKDTFEK
jgi:hypothetical protein